MHRPPPVRMVLATRRQCLARGGVLWCVAFAAVVGWWMAGKPPAAVLWAVLLATLAALAGALRSLTRLGTGELAWADGEWLWQLPDASVAGQVRVRADFQHLLLLEFRPASARTGVWMVAMRQPGSPWFSFRRAVHAAAGLTAPAKHDAGAAWPYGGTA